MYAVILAGGGGTRLRPLSRPDRPKPFLPLLGQRSLLQRTFDRIALLEPPPDVFIVTDQRYGELAREQVPAATVIEEPIGRNTAAAIALAVLAIDRPDDEVMAVLPADHFIKDEVRFREILTTSARVAEGALAVSDPLVTLGVEPDRPATDYGYIMATAAREVRDGLDVFGVSRFLEKPTVERAVELLRGPDHVSWNAGIFVWRRNAIRDSLRRFAPDIYEAVTTGVRAGDMVGAYDSVRPISIDYAVMEPSSVDGRVVVVPMSVGWSDLGSWSALIAALPGAGAPIRDGRVALPGETILLGPDDLLVHSRDQRLELTRGPGAGLVLDGYAAVLTDAGHRAADVAALLERCAVKETGRI